MLSLLMIGLGSLSAQATHYLFFQTENNKPFYLRLMGSTLSSNASGYLLIPKITDGKYEMHIGFAQSNLEQQFEIVMEGKDMGFSVKQELDNSWSLFNLVDFSLHKGKTVAATIKPQTKVEEDPLVISKVKEEEKQVEKKEPKQRDIITKPVLIVKEEPKMKTVLPQVSKIYDKASPEGIDMVFVVNGTPKNDTVILYVPAIKPPGMAGRILKSQYIYASEAAQTGVSIIQPVIPNPHKNP